MQTTKQCKILNLSCSGTDYTPVPMSDKDVELMRLIDRIHLNHPYLGSRGMVSELSRNHPVGRTHVRALMRKMAGLLDGQHLHRKALEECQV